MLVLTAIGVPVARAEDPKEVAATRFREGREAMRQGQYAEACSKFGESEELDASLGTELNLAVCEQRLGHYVRARALVSGFLTRARPEDERFSNSRQLARELDAKIAYLSIRVKSYGRRGTLVLVDGHQLTPADSDVVAVDPGEHRISVSSPECLEQSRILKIAGGEISRQDFTLVSKRPRTPILSHQRPRHSVAVSPLFYVAFGTGLAGLLTAVESAAVIRMDHDKVGAHCLDKRCDATGLAAGRQGRTYAMVNIFAWSTALGGSALATYLFFDRGRTRAGDFGLGLSLAPAQASVVIQANTRW